MKRILGILAIAVCCLLPAHAQEAKTLFVNMPDSLSPLLTKVNRADFVDFLESKMRAQVDNRFGNKSEMIALGKDYVQIQMSPQATWQMKLLPLNDSIQIICTVSTACAPACDSDVRFFTTEWKELPATDFLQIPVMDDYLSAPADSAQVYEFEQTLPYADMLLAKAQLAKENQQLTFTFATIDYMEKETAEKLKPFLRRPLVFEWSISDKRFITATSAVASL